MLMRALTSVRHMSGPVFALKRGIDLALVDGPSIWPAGAFIRRLVSSQKGGLRRISSPRLRTGRSTRTRRRRETQTPPDDPPRAESPANDVRPLDDPVSVALRNRCVERAEHRRCAVATRETRRDERIGHRLHRMPDRLGTLDRPCERLGCRTREELVVAGAPCQNGGSASTKPPTMTVAATSPRV